MPILTAAVSVTTSATLLYTPGDAVQSVVIQNLGTADCYIGGAGVTTATGFKLGVGDSVPFSASPGELVYGRTSASTADVRVTRVGV